MTENNIPRHSIYEFISEDFIGKYIQVYFTLTIAMKIHCNESEHSDNSLHFLKIECCLYGSHKRKPIILIVSISLFLYIHRRNISIFLSKLNLIEVVHSQHLDYGYCFMLFLSSFSRGGSIIKFYFQY